MTFQTPSKRILSSLQLTAFQSSNTHNAIVTYIEDLNNSIIGVKLMDQVSVSPVRLCGIPRVLFPYTMEEQGVKAILDVLDRIEDVAKDTPPMDNKASRFGNPAFRTFYDKVVDLAPSLHATLPHFPEDATNEISAYFVNAWGNRERIDYGSGMELNFLCWLICLERVGVLSESDHIALVIRAFWRYIQVMRILQSTYWLEPAGSHGVWGLDDYHFLPFLFGSAQLRGHKYLRPKAIHDNEVVDELANDYMYFACIKFINSIKTASLRWHSPMLDDISAVKTWEKVNAGMIKMYKAEVLGKLPVMQHFLFGSILPYEGPPPPSETSNERTHGGHVHEGWGDCCGIPIPSVFAAAQEREEGKKIEGPGIRPVPFD
ncbi:Phosphotyrosyl phosphatase activator [Pisolithus microcarpus]|nr:Phosphotyrosyl phosphatase activator [Pisolithus microcarpus]